jgi:hypothetical protein
MAVSKTSQKQLELAGQSAALCKDWPTGEVRGLHPSFHKSMWATWNAAVMLGYLLKCRCTRPRRLHKVYIGRQIHG